MNHSDLSYLIGRVELEIDQLQIKYDRVFDPRDNYRQEAGVKYLEGLPLRDFKTCHDANGPYLVCVNKNWVSSQLFTFDMGKKGVNLRLSEAKRELRRLKRGLKKMHCEVQPQEVVA